MQGQEIEKCPEKWVGEKVSGQNEHHLFQSQVVDHAGRGGRGLASGAGLALLDRSSPVVVRDTWLVDTGAQIVCCSLSWLPRTQSMAHSHVKHTPSLRGLRPLAYPCRPPLPTTGWDGGWWTGQWAQDLQDLVFPEGANVPMYPRTLVTSTPLSTRAQTQPPCHPGYPGILVPPPWPLSTLMYPPMQCVD
jgi:hypothetical protein